MSASHTNSIRYIYCARVWGKWLWHLQLSTYIRKGLCLCFCPCPRTRQISYSGGSRALCQLRLDRTIWLGIFDFGLLITTMYLTYLQVADWTNMDTVSYVYLPKCSLPLEETPDLCTSILEMPPLHKSKETVQVCTSDPDILLGKTLINTDHVGTFPSSPPTGNYEQRCMEITIEIQGQKIVGHEKERSLQAHNLLNVLPFTLS